MIIIIKQNWIFTFVKAKIEKLNEVHVLFIAYL